MMLWHVEGSGLHILGTVHLMDADPKNIPDEVWSLFDEAQRIVLEHDLDPDPQLARALALGTEPLSGLIPTDLFARLNTLWKQAGLDADVLEALRPWAAVTHLQVTLAGRLGFNSQSGIDRLLLGRAKADGKAVVFLEDALDAIRPLADAPHSEQVAFLSRRVLDAEQGLPELRGMLEAWKAGDLAFFERLCSDQSALYPRSFRRVIDERNHLWVRHLEAMADDGKPGLVAVGTLHLVGPEGLPALFASSGRWVVRVDG